jgi:predicted nucleic-acid-binding protein
MIGLDSNVLVRYVMQDDAKQSAKANKLIESLSADRPCFIPPYRARGAGMGVGVLLSADV